MKKMTIMLCLAGLLGAAQLNAEPTDIKVGWIQVQKLYATCISYILFDEIGQPDGKGFVFPIYIAEGAEDIDLERTYVYPGPDMNSNFVMWMLSDYATHSFYTQATFVKTEDEEGYIRIEATAMDQNGDEWAIHYDQKAIEEEIAQWEKEQKEKEEGIAEVYGRQATNQLRKVLQNGQIIIIQGDRKFTILGTPSY